MNRAPLHLLTMQRVLSTSLLLATLVCGAACGGPTAVRGEDEPGFDDQAMSTGLDRRDLQKLLHEAMKALQASAVLERWRREQGSTVAVLPLRNETSEHVDSALQALVSDIETVLVNSGGLRVVSLEQQPALLEQVRTQYQSGFDQSQVAAWGRQLGVRYVVTGKVFSADERLPDERRVQYFLFLQVLEVETSQILFQHRAAVTKGVLG